MLYVFVAEMGDEGYQRQAGRQTMMYVRHLPYLSDKAPMMRAAKSANTPKEVNHGREPLVQIHVKLKVRIDRNDHKMSHKHEPENNRAILLPRDLWLHQTLPGLKMPFGPHQVRSHRGYIAAQKWKQGYAE